MSTIIPDLLPEVKKLAEAKIDKEKARKRFDEDSTLQDSFMVPFNLRYEIAVTEALLATYGNTDQFQLVLSILTPKEVGKLIWYGARYLEPHSVKQAS